MSDYSLKNIITPSAIILGDQRFFAESFGKFLESIDLFSKAHIFSKEDELFHFLAQKRNSVTYLFLDFFLNGKTLASSINEIRRRGKKIRIIILTDASSPVLLKSITDFQPDAILHKSDSIREVVDCIQSVHDGTIYHSPTVLDITGQEQDREYVSSLTFREIEILEYFAQGHTVNETAETLNLSRHTVSAHRRKMFSKTNSNSITELLGYARKINLI